MAAGCLVFAPWLGQSRVPKGSLGTHGGGAPLPHTPSSLALLCLLGALPVFRSPLENLLRTAHLRCAREMGRGNQAPNKEQRFNVLRVCTLSLGMAGVASLRPSPCGVRPLGFPRWPMPLLDRPWPGSPTLVTLLRGPGSHKVPADGEGALGPPWDQAAKVCLFESGHGDNAGPFPCQPLSVSLGDPMGSWGQRWRVASAS